MTICPRCKRIPYSFRHLMLCHVRPVNRDNTIGVRPDELLYLIHRPSQSLSYFTYKLLKDNDLLYKYTTWVQWNDHMFLDINWVANHWIYLLWKEEMTDTCMNIPCDECRQKEIDRATRHSFIKKQLYIQRAKARANSRRLITIDERQRVLA